MLAGPGGGLIAGVHTEIAGVHTAIARLGEQQARTETHRLRWTLGAIVAGSALGVAILRLTGRLNAFVHAAWTSTALRSLRINLRMYSLDAR